MGGGKEKTDAVQIGMIRLMNSESADELAWEYEVTRIEWQKRIVKREKRLTVERREMGNLRIVSGTIRDTLEVLVQTSCNRTREVMRLKA